MVPGAGHNVPRYPNPPSYARERQSPPSTLIKTCYKRTDELYTTALRNSGSKRTKTRQQDKMAIKKKPPLYSASNRRTPGSAQPASKLYVFLLDGDALGVDGAQVGIVE